MHACVISGDVGHRARSSDDVCGVPATGPGTSPASSGEAGETASHELEHHSESRRLRALLFEVSCPRMRYGCKVLH